MCQILLIYLHIFSLTVKDKYYRKIIKLQTVFGELLSGALLCSLHELAHFCYFNSKIDTFFR